MDSDDTQQPAVSEPTGQQLKRAREQKGLSVSAVADAQHLRPAVIHAIEDGDYEQIDSELFLKGYVRTYAKQVDLDPDAVIATLDKELEPLRQQRAQAEELNPLVDIERRRRQKRRVAKLLFFILIIAIVGFVGLRFLDNMDTTPALEEPDNADSASEMIEPVEPEQVESDPDSSESSGAVSGTEKEAGMAESEPVQNESVMAEPTVANVEVPAPSEEPASAPTGSIGDSGVPVVTSTPEPAFEESAQPGAAVGRAQLEMTFTDECWVQVTDSAGNRLVGSLQRDGDRIEVSGRAPMQVIVGAVDAIDTIRFDGEPVNMSGFRVINNRAEFTLDI
jgi:cytoskeleton protein RodZ